MSDPGPGEDDRAWVKVQIPVAPDGLFDFLQDIERLFRINPCLEFESIRREDGGVWQLKGRNDSNQQAIDVRVEVIERIPGRLLAMRYDNGIKRETRCEIEAAAGGSVLTLIDRYDTPEEAQRAARLKEVDRSLVPWAAALRTYLLRQGRWKWLPGYAWYIERFWLGMTPRQRRIAWLLTWTTAAEFVFFLFVFAVYWNEAAG